MIEQSKHQPQKPFLMANRYYIWAYNYNNGFWSNLFEYKVGEEAIKNGKFKIDAFVIDVNCRKYSVEGVKELGYWWPSLIPFLFPRKLVKIEYIYSNPIQLTFEEARHQIIEHVIIHRWAGQTGATPKQWREMRMKCRDMVELIENISFYGKYVY